MPTPAPGQAPEDDACPEPLATRWALARHRRERSDDGWLEGGPKGER